jgi:hypothetical protein
VRGKKRPYVGTLWAGIVPATVKRNSARHGKKEAETVKIKRNSARHGKKEAEAVKIKRNRPALQVIRR